MVYGTPHRRVFRAFSAFVIKFSLFRACLLFIGMRRLRFHNNIALTSTRVLRLYNYYLQDTCACSERVQRSRIIVVESISGCFCQPKFLD